MVLYRYELFCEDEPQDVGFLVGIDDLGLSCEKEEYLLNLFENLKIPNIPNMRNTVSLFTKQGVNNFNNAINELLKAYDDSVFDIACVKINLPLEEEDSIVYQDKNQVCLKKETYEKMQKSTTLIATDDEILQYFVEENEVER